ncbi:MAG: HAMP domain-containing histidine kinase [Burkholderiaceae bacterium]|jgi:signal transduction histidine kinase|nr:HAMP domain-containing histidine kinase [Burkholderiaceae bacterium]
MDVPDPLSPAASGAQARRRWTVLSSIVLLFFSFSVAVAWQLVGLYGELDVRDGRNTLWLLTQAHNMGHLLAQDDELLRRGLVERDALEQQENIFNNRLRLLSEEAQQQRLEYFHQRERVAGAIAQYETIAQGGSIADAPRGSSMHASLLSLIDVLERASSDVMAQDQNERGEQLAQFGSLVRAAFVAFSMVLITGGLLVWQLMRSLSQQREQTRIIAVQRDELQQTVHDLHQAQQATETYRNFVSLVSHQFRTPLAVIDSTAQRLMRSAREEVQSGFADSQMVLDKMNLTRSTIQHLNKLIDSVLTSVRLESGAIQVQTQRVNLSTLMGEVVAANAHLLQDRPLLLETSGDADAYYCLGDAVLLEHVLQNLLSNACKYTQPGTAIAVTLARAGYGTIVCSVRDWGEGVPENELPLLFERFYRSRRSRAAEGTGLGLYLARSIARLHGGNMDASLPEGGGLAIHLKIPAEYMKAPPPLG